MVRDGERHGPHGTMDVFADEGASDEWVAVGGSSHTLCGHIWLGRG